MSTETETGTIKETTLFKDFVFFVKGKFTTMSHFSKIENGSFMTFTRLENKIDNQETRDYIWKLERLAQQLKYDKSIIYISKDEIDKIVKRVYDKARMNKTSVNKWLVLRKFNTSTYSSIINGRNIFKNKSYKKLIKILFD